MDYTPTMHTSQQSLDNQKSLLPSHTYQLDDISSDINRNTSTLGKPSTKRSINSTDLAVLTISLTCLIFAYLTITPTLPLAWHLQYSGQIVIIGFLLSIMNVCMTTILSYTNLLLEARFGPSHLQNYEAILTNKISKSHVSLIWRSVLVFLTLLPIGLSVAYKRFLHGQGTVAIASDPTTWYGVDFPQVSNFAPAGDPIYNFITSVNPFQAAWTRRDYPEEHEFPVAFGYNTLLLSDISAVVLDVPVAHNITSMQSRMTNTESWNVSANVNAYMASYNISTPSLRNDDSYWQGVFNSSYNIHSDHTFVDMNMWGGNNSRIGTIYFDDNTRIAFGLYNASYYSSYDLDYINDYEDPNIAAFRESAGIWDIQRVRCHGNWYINKTSISLTSGSCDLSMDVDQTAVAGNMWGPYQMDTLPIYGHLFLKARGTYMWPWLNTTYAVSLATAHWSRAVYMLNPSETNNIGQYDSLYYKPMSEVIVSSRGTLKASGGLYIVLAIQPFLTVIAFVVSILLRDVPIGKGFGVTAILSGFDMSSSRLIEGAALSGDLKRPVNLKIIPESSGQGTGAFDSMLNEDGRIKYRLTSGVKSMGRSRLQKDKIYW